MPVNDFDTADLVDDRLAQEGFYGAQGLIGVYSPEIAGSLAYRRRLRLYL